MALASVGRGIAAKKTKSSGILLFCAYSYCNCLELLCQDGMNSKIGIKNRLSRPAGVKLMLATSLQAILKNKKIHKNLLIPIAIYFQMW